MLRCKLAAIKKNDLAADIRGTHLQHFFKLLNPRTALEIQRMNAPRSTGH